MGTADLRVLLGPTSKERVIVEGLKCLGPSLLVGKRVLVLLSCMLVENKLQFEVEGQQEYIELARLLPPRRPTLQYYVTKSTAHIKETLL